MIPPAYGLAGVNLHTWTGFGSIPYWNVYVANFQMHGKGTFFDGRFATLRAVVDHYDAVLALGLTDQPRAACRAAPYSSGVTRRAGPGPWQS